MFSSDAHCPECFTWVKTETITMWQSLRQSSRQVLTDTNNNCKWVLLCLPKTWSKGLILRTQIAGFKIAIVPGRKTRAGKNALKLSYHFSVIFFFIYCSLPHFIPWPISRVLTNWFWQLSAFQFFLWKGKSLELPNPLFFSKLCFFLFLRNSFFKFY